MSDKISLFFDMDGVLADFYSDPNYLNRMREKGYFANLKPLPMVNTVAELSLRFNVFDIYVLSACVEPVEQCMQEKHEWLDKYLSTVPKENRILIEAGKNKFDYVPKGIEMPILFDDYSKNIEQWEERGGYAFKIKNNINLRGNKDYRAILDRPSAADIMTAVMKILI